MRPLAATAIVLLVIAPLALAKVDAPSISVGDFWELETRIPIPGGETQTYTIKSTVMARESISVNGSTHDAFRSESHTNQTTDFGGFSTTNSIDSATWSRVSDGASVKTVSNTNSSSNVPGFPPSESTSETTWSPPCESFQFPLDVGEAWSVTCTSTTATTSTAPGATPQTTTTTTTTNYTVLREESVTVPAGTFRAHVLAAETSGSQDVTVYMWYAPLACSVVKTATDVNGTSFTAQLNSYKCANGGESSGGSSTTPPTQTTSGTTTTTSATQTTTATTTPPTNAPTPGLPGPALPLVLAAIAVAVVLATRKR